MIEVLEEKIKKLLYEREWTFARLIDTKSIVEDFSENIYSNLSPKEKLDLVWNKDVNDVKISGMFGNFFNVLVLQEIQLEVANILKSEILNANVNFGDKNKNKEGEINEVSKRGLVGKSHKGRTTISKKDSEE